MAYGIVPPETFFEFLDVLLHQEGWSDYRLSKKANLSGAFMPNLRKGAKIGYEACSRIADALGVPRTEMYVRAGLDQVPAGLRIVIENWRNLTDEEVADYTHLAERAGKRAGAAQGNSRVAKADGKRKR
jgi:hypothetical protein